MSDGTIIAMGGGGFLMEPDNPRLDRYILAQARKPRPRVLFVATASGDSKDAQLRFYKAFAQHDCVPAHLDLFDFDRRSDLRDTVASADVVYVGGGNTAAMLAVWKLYALGAMFREALGHGAVLAGISAGANCWFEQMVTDSVPGGGVIDGLGFAPGIFCPHFDGEAWRRPFVEQIATASRGIACDNSCAVRLDAGGAFVEAVASVAGRQAWHWGDGRLDALPTRLLD